MASQLEKIQQANQIKQRFLNLDEKLQNERKELLNPDVPLGPHLAEHINLAKKFQDAHIGAQSAGILTKFGGLLKERGEKIQVDFSSFTVKSFLSSLEKFDFREFSLEIKEDEPAEKQAPSKKRRRGAAPAEPAEAAQVAPARKHNYAISSKKWWEHFGECCAPIFLPPIPRLRCLSGALIIKHKVRKQSVKRRKEDLGKVQRIKETQNILPGEGAETTKRVTEIGEILQKEGKINLHRFLINPESYAQTVENYFYFSFLVKDGKAALEAEDGEVFAVHSVVDGDSNQNTGGGGRKQTVIMIDYDEWVENIKQKKIRTSLVPSRDYSYIQSQHPSFHRNREVEEEIPDDAVPRKRSKK